MKMLLIGMIRTMHFKVSDQLSASPRVHIKIPNDGTAVDMMYYVK